MKIARKITLTFSILSITLLFSTVLLLRTIAINGEGYSASIELWSIHAKRTASELLTGAQSPYLSAVGDYCIEITSSRCPQIFKGVLEHSTFLPTTIPNVSFLRVNRQLFLRVLTEHGEVYFSRKFAPSISSRLLGFYLTSMLGLIFVAYKLTKCFCRPLSTLHQAVLRIGTGDLSRLELYNTNDEFGVLTRTINWMTKQFSTMITARQQMLIALGHDIRGPLCCLNLAIDQITECQIKKTMINSVERIETQLKQIVDKERERMNLNNVCFELVDMKELCIREITYSFSQVREQIHFECNLHKRDEFILEGDPSRLHILLHNLLKNALFYSEGKRVEVELSHQAGWLNLSVSDSGAGIETQVQQHLFSPFVYGKKGGTGLGLYLCRAVATAHGGDISCNSHLGIGSIFTVSLPLLTKNRNVLNI